MRFPYKRFVVQSRPRGLTSAVSRPVIPIHVSVGQQRIAYEALVDSGADYSIFHAQIGEALGLDIRRGSRVTFAGVGGVAQEGFRHRIELDIQQQRFASHVVFAPGLKIPYGILGQEDLFERFVIVFDHKHGWLDLKPRP